MWEENKIIGVPEYFKNLHLGVCAITGTPRIMSIKEGETYTDKYIDISKEEWESALLCWARELEHGYVQVLKDYTFCVAGKAKDKRSLIMGLRKLADELESIINKQLTTTPLEVTGENND